MTTDIELPPLPAPLIRRGDFPAFQTKIAMDCYAATQMDDHARAAIEADRSRRAIPGDMVLWTLTAPDGRQWQADSALKCAAAEQRERIPAKTALERIFAEVDDFEREERAAIVSELEPHALPAAQCPPDSMVVTLYAIKRTLAAAPTAAAPADGADGEAV